MRESFLSLADTMAGPDPVRAKAAKLQMATEVHAACAPKKSGRDRAPYRITTNRPVWCPARAASTVNR